MENGAKGPKNKTKFPFPVCQGIFETDNTLHTSVTTQYIQTATVDYCYCRLLLQADAPTRPPTYHDTTANTDRQTSMKQKGVREPPPPGVRHHETTRDERLKVITLRDESGMSWAEIGRRLNIHRRSKRVVLPLAALTLKAYSIDRLYPDIPQSKRDRRSFESKPLWPPRIIHRCRKARIDRSPDLNLIEALWQDVEVEFGQISGRVSDLEALEAAVRLHGILFRRSGWKC